MLKGIHNASVAKRLSLGVFLSVAPLALLWGLFPGHELEKASTSVKGVLRIVNENYVDADKASYDKLAHYALHGMVESLDPHSEFLESKDNKAFEEDLDGKFGGVGIEVELHQGHLTIVAVTPNAPSDKVGLKRGDYISTIDGFSVEHTAKMQEAVERLRGKPKTDVAVSVFRPSLNKTLSFNITREIINVNSVIGEKVLDQNIGYLRITEFSDNTGEQFWKKLNALLEKNIQALVIDLRDNPGGLLDAAVEVAEPFFKKGDLIVYTQGRKPTDKEEFKSETEGEALIMPVAILINEGTASAAEIVTGALKDTGKAIVVGERSFGKGSVQTIIKLASGEALRLTTAHYYTPNGKLIHQKGVSPHVEVVLSAEDDAKINRQVSREDITDPKEFKEHFGFEPIQDTQLLTALDVLKGVQLYDLEKIIETEKGNLKTSSTGHKVFWMTKKSVHKHSEFSGIPLGKSA
jgi:carboxyl-terminal processing protease